MKKLQISDHLALPLDAVTQTIGILAKRRAGKSFLARRLTEQLVKADLQVVIVDPKGDWWGIRSAADGKDAGLPIVILGGERGDVKLEPSAGEVVAKLVVEERVSVLLDLSLLRKHEVATFMAAFLEQLYRLKAREEFREPVMLMIDEADAIAPQSPKRQGAQGGNVERMLGAAEDIVRRGGQRGIGCTLITQRSAVLNKNVLTQIQILIALRTIAPQDLGAMNEWIDVHGTQEQRKTLMGSLPSLPVGDAWVWSPGWPTDDGIFERVHVLPIETFDSGSTPKPGVKRREPKTLARVDLAALERQMAETLERTKAEDPRELQKTVRELRAQVAKLQAAKPAAAPAPAKAPRIVEKLVLKDAQVKRLEAQTDRVVRAVVALQSVAHDLDVRAKETVAALAAARAGGDDGALRAAAGAGRASEGASRGPAALPGRERRPAPVTSPQLPDRDREGTLPRAQQRILDSLAWLHGVGIPKPDKTQVALFADLTPGAGHTVSMFGALRTAGLIDYPTPGSVALTAAGRAQADDSRVPQTAEEMQAQVLAKLPKAQREILRVLIPAHPAPVAKEDVATKAGLVPGAGHTVSMFGRLRSLGLIDYPTPGQVVATPVLFLS